MICSSSSSRRITSLMGGQGRLEERTSWACPLCPTVASEERHERRGTSELLSKSQGPRRDSSCLDQKVRLINTSRIDIKTEDQKSHVKQLNHLRSCHLGSPAFRVLSSVPTNFTVFLWHADPHLLLTTVSYFIHHYQPSKIHFLLFHSLFHPYTVIFLPHHPTKIY